MTRERFARVEELFAAARKLAPDARDQFLERMCGDDPALRAEVRELLVHDDDLPPFLKSGFIDGASLATSGDDALQLSRIGRYRILRKLGEGGFGIVYLAEQENPRRPVAVKVLKPHIAGDAMLKRFENEAEVLGRLIHPGIARIYEAGAEPSADGVRAFFAMEFVEGPNLADYLKSRSLSAGDILDLFARIGDAVEYAHLQGVIHRDLKPQNVLVGSDRQPRVVDFGIARDLAPDDATRITDAGHLLGTLPYMSPEQLGGDARTVDARCDTYALGVMLYEALAGRLPYDVEGQPLAVIIRRRCGEDAPSLGTIASTLRGEIEIIVKEAMERDPARRYQSVGALATDIRRFLAGEPIEAKRDSAMYVLRKRLERYRGTLIVGGMLLVLTLASAVIAFSQSASNRRLAIRESAAHESADQALGIAREEKRRADTALNDLKIELRTNHIERGRLTGLAGSFRDAEQMIWGEVLRWPDCASAYWALWELYSRFPCLASIPAHAGIVRALTCSPDRQWLATASEDRTVRIWSVDESLTEQFVLRHRAQVTATAFVGGGGLVASGDVRGELRIWQRDTGGCVGVAHAHEGEIRALAPVGSDHFASIGADGAIRLWQVEPLGAAGECSPDRSPLLAMAVTADGKRLAAGGNSLVIHVFDVLRRPDGPVLDPIGQFLAHWEPISSLAFSPDGSLLASGARDRNMALWSVPSGKREAWFDAANGTVRAVAFSPSGRTLVDAGWWSIDLWDVRSQKRNSTLPLQRSTRTVDFLSEERIISSDENGSPAYVHVWETRPLQCLRRLHAHSVACRCVDITGDGRMLATGGSDGILRVWRMSDQALVHQFRAHGEVRGLSISPDARLVAGACSDGWVGLWNLESGDRISFESWHGALNGPIVFLRDSQRVLIGLSDGTAAVYDVRTGQRIASWQAGKGECVSTCVSADGRMVATGFRDSRVRLWNSSDLSLLAELVPPQEMTPWGVDLTKDGKYAACGTWNHEILVWDTASHEVVAQMKGHTQLIYGVSFSPESELLATCSVDGEIKLWDWRGSSCLATLNASAGFALNVKFAPDGKMIIAAYSDGSVGFWDLTYYDRHIEGNRAAQVGSTSE